MAFLSDPYQRQQLALMLAGGTSGMGGVPRLAGWSAPIGAFGRGLAQTMPYMMQMQQQQQEQQQQQAAMAQLQQGMQGMPNVQNNPMWPVFQQLGQAGPYGAEMQMKMLPEMLKPVETMKPMSSAGQLAADYQAGKIDEATYKAEKKKMEYISPPASTTVNVKNEGPIPSGYEAVRDAQGNLVSYRKVAGGPLTVDQEKNAQLYSRASQQLPILLGDGMKPGTFESLANPRDVLATSILPEKLQGYATTPDYQRSSAALQDIAQSYGYSVSGATMNPDETKKLAKVLTPVPGEDPQTTQEKKARIQQMVQSMRLRAAGNIEAADTLDAQLGLVDKTGRVISTAIPPPPPGFILDK